MELFNKTYKSLTKEIGLWLKDESLIKKSNDDIEITTLMFYYTTLSQQEKLLFEKNEKLFELVEPLSYISLKEKWDLLKEHQKRIWVYLKIMYQTAKKYYDQINNVELKNPESLKDVQVGKMLENKFGIKLTPSVSSVVNDITKEVTNEIKSNKGKVNIQNLLQGVMKKVGTNVSKKIEDGELDKAELENSAKSMLNTLKNKIGGKKLGGLLKGNLSGLSSLFESAEDKKARMLSEKEKRKEKRMKRMRKELKKKYKMKKI